ncbi:MAG: golvesin C-terminal-like domain-containing protein [Syntrophorhabdaceae bacterium]
MRQYAAFILAIFILVSVISPCVARSAEIIVDNGAEGTSSTGTWALSGGTNPYGGSSLWSRDGATYTFSMNGQPAGNYEVLMWWSGWSTRASSVPVAISHGTGTKNLTVDQFRDPGQWNSLGTYYFNGTGRVIVTAANGDLSSTCADAVQFRFLSGNQPPAAFIESITPSPANTGESVTFSGRGADSDGTITGYQWNSSIDGIIGTQATFSKSDLSSGSHTITFLVKGDDNIVSEASTSALIVGAASHETIIDNADSSQTSRTGTWGSSSAAGYYNTGSVWSRDGATFTWKFTPAVSGTYNVAMWWTTTSTRSSSIPILINHSNGSKIITINQLQNAGKWNSFGEFSFVAGNTYDIVMTSQPAPASTCADAVKFTLVSEGLKAVIDSITPSTATEGQAVTFAGHGTGGTITSYQWTSSIDGVFSNFADFATSSLSVGTHTITFKVKDDTGVWSQGSTGDLAVNSQPAATIIDNTDSRTSRTGTWTVSTAAGFYGTGSIWSRDGATFTWKFTPAEPGYYEVFMWWTTTSSRSSSVPVTIDYEGGSKTVLINQLLYPSQWNSLGTYPFAAGSTYTVTVRASAAPASTCVDAISFRKSGSGAPQANFEADLRLGSIPMTVRFTDLSTGDIASVLWDFGDGSTSQERNPAHTYTVAGYYTVSLTATNVAGSDTKTIPQYIGTTNPDVEHMYIGDGYSSDGAFAKNVKMVLTELGATDSGDIWYYTNRSTGKVFIIHFVHTPYALMNAFKQTNAHIIWNGHSNYGLGGTFAEPSEIALQQLDDVKYIDDDNMTHISTPTVSLKIDGMQYGQAYPNWKPVFKDGTSGIMPYTFAEGTPPYNYYLTYRVPGDPTLYKIQLANGEYLERFPDSGVPAWFSPSGNPPSPTANPEYFIVNNDMDYNRCDFIGTWPVKKEEEDVRSYTGYNYQYHAAGTGSDSATWNIVVRNAGYYQVTATWQSADTNASNARYTIAHGEGITTVEADQRLKIKGYPLGTYYFGVGSYNVTLTDNANGRVVADSIRLSSIEGVAPRTTAEFSASGKSGGLPLAVSFTDLSESFSTSGDEIVEWFWDFGDGATSTERSPQHIYSKAGTYAVSLTVTTASGQSDTEIKERLIEAGSTNSAKANFAAQSRLVTTRTAVQFTNLSSASAISFLWDFGDGTTSTKENPSHTYSTSGTYTVTLTVNSSSGSDVKVNDSYIKSVYSSRTSMADNTHHYKPHYRDSSGSPKTIVYGNTAINENELKYSRVFYSSCNSCNYYGGNFHRGIMYCTTSDSNIYTGMNYIQNYLAGLSDDTIVQQLNMFQDIHEMINFNLKPPSLR